MKRHHPPTLRGPVIGLAAALLVGACGQGPDGPGRAEAVELLVLDGLDRAVADCVVSRVEGVLDLAEVTGVSEGLDQEELGVLLEASSACRPVAADLGHPVGGSADLDDLEAPLEGGPDVDDLIAELLRGGLDPELVVCVAESLAGSSGAPQASSGDELIVEAVRICGS
ncbi:MAG: hypothetical protein ACE5GB_12065 [Acidimicrobiales bacterium]